MICFILELLKLFLKRDSFSKYSTTPMRSSYDANATVDTNHLRLSEEVRPFKFP